MSKLLRSLEKASDIVGDKQIVVSSTIVSSQMFVLMRQVLLALGGGLVTNGVVTDDQLQQIVGGLVALITLLYGQYKARQDKAEKLVLADAAPNYVAEVKK